ncbi:MAG TPA: vWA domain-containing protein, partial [Verrucomicrobiae bacterium]
MNHWSISASTPVMVLAVLVWLGAGWLCWANWHRRGGKAMAALEALRFVIMTVIGITLLKPEFVQKIVSNEPPEIVVLNDASGSMETRDVMIEGRIIRRDEWLQLRRQTNFWRPLEKNARVMVEDFSRPSTNAAAAANEDGTDINEALESVRQRQKHLKAVLMLTDGDWNLGKSPLSAATRLRGENVPIYTVAIGSETPLPDLVLQQVIAPSYGLMGEQISIPYRVQSFLPREVKTVITLSSARGVDVRKEITIPAFAQLQDSIVWSPRGLGEYTLTLKLPVQPDEYLSDNNDQTFRISIRTEKLNVLVVDSLPRWE